VNTIVCVKRVADSEARIRIGPAGAVDTSGLKFVLNPYDEFAIEAALRQKEADGAGDVTLVSAGPPEAAEALRAGLAMGADQATLLRIEGSAEGMAVASALAAELRGRNVDLVLFGLKAIDDDLSAVGPMVAELLDLPAVTGVTEFAVEGSKVVAQREVEGGVEVLECRLPCVLSITKGPHTPRYASLKGIMAAKKKPIDEKPAQFGDPGVHTVGLEYPPERKPGRILTGDDSIPELLRLLREEAQIL
jgi:electron transfer flavoprotein beta subunit